ncbi:gliding motility-associated-like protein [Catalinimonas alkaloidigena]|uniref:T9SS type B sorting domain-containing protein n=1 Tax=Catalinimonas alkaloidigena TaxID=1075417 RepID=UPI002405A7E7|nr:gliding motility-associated C-terminal domain-containing protein [Catalinimonas alkaloidigena]MDF9794964.1 gliding motility-associated-like protein [Catalinimonas alkaloidigena]
MLITDLYTRNGVVYLYSTDSDWKTGNISYIALDPPHDPSYRARDFGRSLDVSEDLLVIGAPGSDSGRGRVFVYKDMSSSNWTNLQHQATLTSSSLTEQNPYFGYRVKIMKGNIFVQSKVPYSLKIFQFKPRAIWQDTISDTTFYLSNTSPYPLANNLIAHDSTLLFIAKTEDQIKAYSFRLTPENTVLTQEAPQLLYTEKYFRYSPSKVDVDSNGNLAIGYENDPTGIHNGGAVWVIPKPLDQWMFSQKSEVTTTYFSTSQDYFGHSLLKVKDRLFVGAPRDKRSYFSSGSVQVYRKDAMGWQKEHEILADSGSLSLGNSFQFQNDTLYATDKNSIRLYKKESDWQSWSSLKKISLPDSLTITNFGDNIKIEGSLLVTTGQVHLPKMAIKNALFIFEKSHHKWEYQQFYLLHNSNPLDKQFAVSLDIHKQTILAVDREGFIIEKNENGLWETTAKLIPNAPPNGHRFGHSVILKHNLALIGASGFGERYEYNKGIVYVFQKTDSSWQTTYEHQVIRPKEPLEQERFGTSMALMGDKLAIGAPVVNYVYDKANFTEVPGSVYIFQVLDSSFNQFIELAKIQGDMNTLGDLYGQSLLMENDTLIVGAPLDSHENGSWGGAVYHTPITALMAINENSIVETYCATDTLVYLEVNVTGGVWKGAGIIDSQSGTFSPIKAGAGEYKLLYQTHDCSYRELRTVKVLPQPHIEFQHDKELWLCNEEYIPLSIAPMDSLNYQWFYLAEDSSKPKALESDTSQIQVNQPGKYWIRIHSQCSWPNSDSIEISRPQAPVLQLPAQQYACDPSPILSIDNFNQNYTYRLYWQNSYGDFLQFQEIDRAEYHISRPGSYQLLSNFNSCEWTSETFTILKEIEDFNITTEAANTESCYQDQWFKAPQGEQYSYSWKCYPEEDDQATTIGSAYKVLADKTGYYEVTIYYVQCSWASDKQYFIRKEIDGLAVTPEATEIEACAQELWLEAPLQEGFTYTWNYYSEEGEIPIAIGNENKLLIELTGYYELNIRYGLCDWKSEKKYVKIHEPTVIEEMGNVITPNGDGVNDTFGIPLNNTIKYELSIFNRLGKLVFQTQDPNARWGESCAAGVYVWNLSYQNICDQSPTHKKGMLSIVRRKN